jgi:hypothetical protein
MTSKLLQLPDGTWCDPAKVELVEIVYAIERLKLNYYVKVSMADGFIRKIQSSSPADAIALRDKIAVAVNDARGYRPEPPKEGKIYKCPACSFLLRTLNPHQPCPSCKYQFNLIPLDDEPAPGVAEQVASVGVERDMATIKEMAERHDARMKAEFDRNWPEPASEIIDRLRAAGGDGWDKIEDPAAFLGRESEPASEHERRVNVGEVPPAEAKAGNHARMYNELVLLLGTANARLRDARLPTVAVTHSAEALGTPDPWPEHTAAFGNVDTAKDSGSEPVSNAGLVEDVKACVEAESKPGSTSIWGFCRCRPMAGAGPFRQGNFCLSCGKPIDPGVLGQE